MTLSQRTACLKVCAFQPCSEVRVSEVIATMFSMSPDTLLREGATICTMFQSSGRESFSLSTRVTEVDSWRSSYIGTRLV